MDSPASAHVDAMILWARSPFHSCCIRPDRHALQAAHAALTQAIEKIHEIEGFVKAVAAGAQASPRQKRENNRKPTRPRARGDMNKLRNSRSPSITKRRLVAKRAAPPSEKIPTAITSAILHFQGLASWHSGAFIYRGKRYR